MVWAGRPASPGPWHCGSPAQCGGPGPSHTSQTRTAAPWAQRPCCLLCPEGPCPTLPSSPDHARQQTRALTEEQTICFVTCCTLAEGNSQSVWRTFPDLLMKVAKSTWRCMHQRVMLLVGTKFCTACCRCCRSHTHWDCLSCHFEDGCCQQKWAHNSYVVAWTDSLTRQQVLMIGACQGQVAVCGCCTTNTVGGRWCEYTCHLAEGSLTVSARRV